MPGGDEGDPACGRGTVRATLKAVVDGDEVDDVDCAAGAAADATVAVRRPYAGAVAGDDAEPVAVAVAHHEQDVGSASRRDAGSARPEIVMGDADAEPQRRRRPEPQLFAERAAGNGFEGNGRRRPRSRSGVAEKPVASALAGGAAEDVSSRSGFVQAGRRGSARSPRRAHRTG